jgi:chitin synthase
MSRYPEVAVLHTFFTGCVLTHFKADEGQHRHYNDGYNPYPSSTPSPYDDPSYQAHGHSPDPFVNSGGQAHPGAYHSPQLLGAPMGLHPSSSPPLPSQDYLNYQSDYGHSQQSFTPQLNTPSSYTVGYDLHDDQPEDQDTGDIPLLRKRGGSQSTHFSIPRPVPGGYDDVTPDDRSENNIRYGRIPQRVPRRYKTIKKVE